MTENDGKALRALLSPSQRRRVRQAARGATDGLWAALDHVDDLLGFESIGPMVLSEAEKIALGHARTAILSAFHALKVGAPDLCGLIPAEAMASAPEQCASVAPASQGRCTKQEGHDGLHSDRAYEWGTAAEALQRPFENSDRKAER